MAVSTFTSTMTGLQPPFTTDTATTYTTSTYTQDIVWVNMGPLTTVFTPPPSCATRTPLEQVVLGPQSDLIAAPCDDPSSDSTQDDYAAYGSCAPSSSAIVSAFAAAATITNLQPYYSPGVYCPSGYDTASSYTQGAATASGGFVNDVFVGTHLICCPSGYKSFNTELSACVSTPSAATTFTNLCLQNCTMGETCPSPSPVFYNPVTEPTLTAEAYLFPLYLVHQAGDVPSGGPTATAAPGSTMSPSTSPKAGTNGAGRTGSAGVVMSVAAAVMAAVGFGAWLL